MVAYLLNTLLFLNLIASGVYLLSKGLLIFAKKHVDERFRYKGCIAVMLLFLIPFYQLLPVSSAQKAQAIPAGERLEDVCVVVPEDAADQMQFLAEAEYPSQTSNFSLHPETQKGILVLWSVGTASLGLWYLCTFRHFRRRLFQVHGRPVSGQLQQIANLCAKECGLRQTPILKALPNVQGPMLIGFFRPIIAVPVDGLPADGAAWILKHELAHYKRHDLWWKLLGVVLQTIHWFNPLVWMLCKEFEFFAETSCDAEVVQNLNHHQRKEYGYLLISYVQSQHKLQPMPGISFTPARNKLKRRISIMLNGNKSQKVIAAAIVCVLAAGSFALSAFAAENQEPIVDTVDSIVTDKEGVAPSSKPFTREVKKDIPVAETIDPEDGLDTENEASENRPCQRTTRQAVCDKTNCDQQGSACSQQQGRHERAMKRDSQCKRACP